MSTTKEAKPRIWYGAVPTTCDFSGQPIVNVFIDGRMPGTSRWGNFHPTSFANLGGKVSPGNRQKYERQADGRFLKIGG